MFYQQNTNILFFSFELGYHSISVHLHVNLYCSFIVRVPELIFKLLSHSKCINYFFSVRAHDAKLTKCPEQKIKNRHLFFFLSHKRRFFQFLLISWFFSSVSPFKGKFCLTAVSCLSSVYPKPSYLTDYQFQYLLFLSLSLSLSLSHCRPIYTYLSCPLS